MFSSTWRAGHEICSSWPFETIRLSPIVGDQRFDFQLRHAGPCIFYSGNTFDVNVAHIVVWRVGTFVAVHRIEFHRLC